MPLVGMSKAKGLSFKVRGKSFREVVWGKYFTQRSVGDWNVLPVLVVEADMKVMFKTPIVRYMDM